MLFRLPEIGSQAFNCPFCGAFVHQQWGLVEIRHGGSVSDPLEDLTVSRCCQCGGEIYWRGDKVMHPKGATAPAPHAGLCQEVAGIYREAAAVLPESPSAAAALLRLALQGLCIQLGQDGQDMGRDISALVDRGLNPEMTTVLQIMRTVGDEATEPGRIDRRDDVEVTSTLFQLINQIAEQMVEGQEIAPQPTGNTAEPTVTAIPLPGTAYQATA